MPAGPADDADPRDIARTAIEMLVFAPIGLGAKLVEDAPGAARRVRQELNNARFIGRLTVEQGTARMRDRAAAPGDTSAVGDAHATGDDPDEGGIAIAGYDEMPAIEIVALLDGLTAAERDAVEAHEQANRQRRTVLGKIAQLAE